MRKLDAPLTLLAALLVIVATYAYANPCPIGSVWVAVPIEQLFPEEDPGGFCLHYHEPQSGGSYEAASCASEYYCALYGAEIGARGDCPPPNQLSAFYAERACSITCIHWPGGWREPIDYQSCVP